MLDFYQIAESSNDIIFTCTFEGYFTYVNEFGARIIGVPKEGIIGKHFSDFVAEDERLKVQEYYSKSLQEGFANHYFEFPIITNSGNRLWVGQTSNIYADGKGNPAGVFAVARPITKLKSVEHSLSESEAKLKSIINSALDAVIVINEKGVITEWNEQSERTFGWTKNWVIGKLLSETIIPEEFRAAHEKGLKHFLKTGEGPVLNKRIEITAVRKNGEVFPVELSIIPNKIDGIYFFSAFVRDLTETKKSERTLQAINELAISLLGKTELEEIAWEITQNTIEKLNFEDCVVYIVNENNQSLNQIAAFGSKNPQKGVIENPISIPIGKGVVGKVAESGEAILIKDTSKYSEYIIDDEPRFSELAVPIIDEGRVIGVIDSEHPEKEFYNEEHLKALTTIANLVSSQISNAIATRKKEEAEQSLRESEERWHKLVDNQPEALQITKKGRIVYLNPAGLMLYEVDSINEIFGKDILELAGPDMESVFKERLSMLLSGEKISPLEFEITTFKGRKRIIEVSSAAVFYDGEKAVQTIARDITQKKEDERRKEKLLRDLEKANDQLNEFAHIVSHDLKAPLRAISSLSEWLVEDFQDKLDESGMETLDMIVDNVERMDQLIDGILTYSISDQKDDLQEELDVDVVIESIISSIDIPVHIQLHIQKGFPKIKYNKIQLSQVLQNLISNSVKYMDKQKGEVRVGFSETEEEVLVEVSDNGPGIPKDVGDEVFNMFSTFHESDIGSTGIGLSITKKIIENRGGKIWFSSEIEKGTTFYFTIKKDEANNEKP